MVKLIASNDKSIKQAAEIIRNGGLVGMPTETVYGLAADACNEEAVAKIFKAKGRPNFNPLISHFAHIKDIEEHAFVCERAKALATHFWPGPLTMVLKRRETSNIADNVTAGLPTIAVRIPAHETARSLIKEAGTPLAAPSANTSGKLSPTSALHVAHSLGDKVDMILAAGLSKVGLESTVIDLSADTPTLLRPGGVTIDQLKAILAKNIANYKSDKNGQEIESKEEIKSPGLLLKHYAPNAKLRLNAVDLHPNEALLAFGSIKFMGIKGGGAAQDLSADNIRNLSETQDLEQAAANLFNMLHELDSFGHKHIAVMNIPDIGIGKAINDRLNRAAYASNNKTDK